MQWGPLLLREGGIIQIENGINQWYSSTHVIHPPMEFIHGIVSGIQPWYLSTHGIVGDIHPWYSLTHGIFPWYRDIHPWYSFTHGIDPWYYN